MKAFEILSELELPKNAWELIVSNADKEEVGGDLVSLVQQAYSSTPQGSFVNSIKDVIPSDWNVIDWDQDPDVDATVFYRTNRQGETWRGYKIQGLGHDGTRTSKDKAIAKIQEMLSRPGVWIESSDAMRHILKKLNTPSVTDVKLLQRLFNDPSLTMIDEDTYRRKLPSGQTITETVFGNPRLKMKVQEDISQPELDQVEKFADALWGKLGVDVEFTRHFFDRVNDARNGKPISSAELIRLFKKEFERNGRPIANLQGLEAVMKDLTTSINLPFVIKDLGDKKQLVAKTVMRKPEFKTPDPEFIVK